MIEYAFQYGPHGSVFEGPGKDGRTLTLVAALDAVRGVFDARILRLHPAGHWTVVVRNAGGECPVHAPSGRTLHRGPARRTPSRVRAYAAAA